jgi:hypothetical protein
MSWSFENITSRNSQDSTGAGQSPWKNKTIGDYLFIFLIGAFAGTLVSLTIKELLPRAILAIIVGGMVAWNIALER